MPTPFLVIFGNFFHLFLVRPKKRNINKCWLTFLKNKKQLKYVQKNPNGVWFQLLKDMLTGIARQSRLLHWILIYMDKNLCKLSQSTNLQKTPRGWSQILIQHSMPLLHEFKCFSLFHFFTFSHFQILFPAMTASLKISSQTPYSLNQSHEDHLLIFFCPAFAFLELKEFYWSQQVPTTLILFQRVIGPSYVYICKNNGKYIYKVLVYNSIDRFGLCVHV